MDAERVRARTMPASSVPFVVSLANWPAALPVESVCRFTVLCWDVQQLMGRVPPSPFSAANAAARRRRACVRTRDRLRPIHASRGPWGRRPRPRYSPRRWHRVKCFGGHSCRRPGCRFLLRLQTRMRQAVASAASSCVRKGQRAPGCICTRASVAARRLSTGPRSRFRLRRGAAARRADGPAL